MTATMNQEALEGYVMTVTMKSSPLEVSSTTTCEESEGSQQKQHVEFSKEMVHPTNHLFDSTALLTKSCPEIRNGTFPVVDYTDEHTNAKITSSTGNLYLLNLIDRP